MEHFKDISLKLYSILLSSNDKTQEARNLESDDDEDLPRECYYCAELFFEVQNFEIHNCIADEIVSKNVNTKHKCSFDGCEKSFGKAGMLRKHERIHLNIRNFQCNKCFKSFIHQTSLRNHLLTHTKVKKFICSTCGHAFTTNGNLNQHRKSHDESSQRQFICEVCDRRFNRASNLKEHFATHMKEKFHQCETCKKKFASSSSLAKHRKIHTGIKPFQCSAGSCMKSFMQRSQLQKHLAGGAHSRITKGIQTTKPTIIKDEIIAPAIT